MNEVIRLMLPAILVVMALGIITPAYASAEVVGDNSLDLLARQLGSYDWLFQTSVNMEESGDAIYDFTANTEANSTAIRLPPHQFFIADLTGNNVKVIFRFTGKQADNSSVPNWVYLSCGNNFEYMIDIAKGSTYDDNRFYYVAYDMEGTDGSSRYSTCRIATAKDVQVETIFTARYTIYDTSLLDYEENILVCQKATINKWLLVIQKISQYLMNMVSLIYYITVTIMLVLVKYIIYPLLLIMFLIGVRYMSKRMTRKD